MVVDVYFWAGTTARVGHVGMYRDPDFIFSSVLMKFPQTLRTRTCLVVDPMLATGGSLNPLFSSCVRLASRILLPDYCFLSEGVKGNSDGQMYASLHPHLTVTESKWPEHSPVSSDAGDRIYGNWQSIRSGIILTPPIGKREFFYWEDSVIIFI